MTEPLSGAFRTLSPARIAGQADETGRTHALPHPGTTHATSVEPDRESLPRTPRWVKAFGIVVVVVALLFVGLHVTGNVPSHTPGSSGAEHGMQVPLP
jgi:hypothetical protein